MRKKFKNAARLIVVFMILATCTKCQKDDDLGQANDKTLLSAKQWFKNYETEGSNYALFQNLDYNWSDAAITNSEDGTKTIIVPINEVKKDPTENWEQKLYIYKLAENNYEASLIEIYPDKNNTDPDSSLIESEIFTGYISVGDLKKGFLKVAKFENGKLVENGIINLRSKNKTAKAPSNQVPCPVGTDCDTDIPGGGTPLKEVVVNNNYQNPGTGYIIIYNNSGGGYTGDTTGGYTNHGTGTGTGESGDNANNTNNPCDKIKAQMLIVNITAKIDELKKKTNLKVETGYSQSKQGPFTAITGTSSTDNADKMNFQPDSNTVGYIHTHLDPYDKVMANRDIDPVEPIKIFSPKDVRMFLILVLNANRYSIPINDVYGTMVSSTGIYQLRFTGNIADVSVKGSSITWDEGLDKIYKEIMKKNSLEEGFLKFLNQQIGINGIELYKIENSGNSKKVLDNTGKVATINCN
ncbi:hypothetical protein [Flavobacterium sp. UBA7680]|uniref:hypothetical protein n=1 Tax=Flavobacterium sp. UBA7680 TaxID=1946559 RepID=UPI0025BB2AE1|nr:hypothetical protein [Flavobacterium sp. UBA7680]